MRYPCVVKPASWVQTSGDRCRRNSGFIPTFGEKAVRAASREDLASMMLAALQLSTPVVVQQEIIGDCADNWGLSLYASQSGDIWVGPALRKTRQYPPDFGTGCCMVPTSEPRIAEISSKFVSALGFHGVADIDIKRDQATDEFYLIEINPRPGACITAASANGTNTPYIAYCDLVGLPVPVPREPEQKVIWVDAWPDTMHFVRYRRSGPMGRRLSWTAWRRSVRSPREGAFYTADDPLPGLRRGLDLSFALARGACRRLVRAVRRPADK
jgi:predicted ATP-grasp superfamily ATP-dependent carboligase